MFCIQEVNEISRMSIVIQQQSNFNPEEVKCQEDEFPAGQWNPELLITRKRFRKPTFKKSVELKLKKKRFGN